MPKDEEDTNAIDVRGNMDRRTKTYQDLVGMTPRSDDLLSDKIDGDVYQYRREYRCRVCSSDNFRELIDSLLVAGYSYAYILEKIEPLQQDVSDNRKVTYWSIRNHQKRHLPFDKLAVREIIERRASDKGHAILEGKTNLLSAEAVYELIAKKGFQAIAAGQMHPDVTETMKAASLLDKLEKDASDSIDRQRMLVQLNAIINAVREVVPEDMWQQIVDRVEVARANAPAVEYIPADSNGYVDESLDE